MSKLEQELLFQIKASKLPIPISEYKFHKSRKWRLDFVWLDEKFVVEVEGGIYKKGRHTRPIGFKNDCEKYNEAELAGFHVLRVTSDHIKNGKAIEWIERALQKNNITV